LVFLLDHALLMVEQKNKVDLFMVYRRVREVLALPCRPPNISLPCCSSSRFASSCRSPSQQTKPACIPSSPPAHSSTDQLKRCHAQPYPPLLPVKFEGGGKAGFSITLVHLGRKFYQMTLWAATYANHRKRTENVTQQQDLIREGSQFFETSVFSEGVF
jgi:hypothetical protein